MSNHVRSPCGKVYGLILSCCLVFLYVMPHAVAVEGLSPGKVSEAWLEGRFLDAARMGEGLGTSDGLALAAQSLSAHAHYIAKDSEKRPLLERAIQLAEKSVLLDPANAEAHLQLAGAIGRHAQAIGAFKAVGQGLAEKIRESTEKALEADPEMALAYISLGRWNAEIIGAAGSLMARILYGARKKDAIAAFERALELAPDDKVVLLEYALGMLALDRIKHREKARGLLLRLIELPASNAYEQLVHKQATGRLQALDTSLDEPFEK